MAGTYLPAHDRRAGLLLKHVRSVVARESVLRHRARGTATAASLWQIGMAHCWCKKVAGAGVMRAALYRLALRVWCAAPSHWVQLWRAAK